jgi:Asp-tRNA(Asn)/Glu-tRNA(Gln) amidotransferase A subunit family amidase
VTKRTSGGGIDRRRLILAGAAAGLTGAAAAAPAKPGGVTADLVAQCDLFAGLDFTGPEREQMLATVDEQIDRLRMLRAIHFENDLGPAEIFDPRLPGWKARPLAPPAKAPAAPPLPSSGEDIAFAPAWAQAAWIASGKLTSRALTDLYLDRIAKRADRLHCIITLLADSARAEADARDKETKAGKSRGPLHGLPYGLKDLFDTKDVRTTWGGEPWRDRIATRDAAVVERLRAAGAVLIAKTSCGAIAYGDIWFGGRTRNPWNIEEGSSGSSAGSAAAVADGLCSFAIGTETMGSIVSPSTRCGTVGLRPTFGRVSRTGAMALCWSLDKVGAIARSARDTGLVVRAIHGTDGIDPGAIDLPFAPTAQIDPKQIRLGYRPEWYEGGPPTNRAALDAARAAGFHMVEITLPATKPSLLGAIVQVESAAAFEDLTLSGADDTLAWQEDNAWPNGWRATRFEPAIGYVQAQRLRRRLMGEFAVTMKDVDAILHPNDAGGLLGIGNHCGYPTLVLPAGFVAQPSRIRSGAYVDPAKVPAGTVVHPVPFAISITGHLFDEPRLLAIGERLERNLPPMGRPTV